MTLPRDAPTDARVGMEIVSTIWLTGKTLLGDSVVFGL
jgi:hypothetical protein